MISQFRPETEFHTDERCYIVEIRKLSRELLKVVGNNAAMPHDGDGFRYASRTELGVYLAPLAILMAVIVLVVRRGPQRMKLAV